LPAGDPESWAAKNDDALSKLRRRRKKRRASRGAAEGFE
jgi:hypothetical protein